MLVLTRKIGEAIQIGDQVSIEVLEVRGGRVRLGISAPSDVGVHRSELLLSDETPAIIGRQFGLSAAVQRRPVAVSGS